MRFQVRQPYANKFFLIMYFVYIIECTDGSLYTGISTDVERRFKEHENKKGGRYTSAKGVKQVLYSEKLPDRSAALKREAKIKKLSRSNKLLLIEHGSPRAR